MRILLHYDRPEVFVDILTRRHPGDKFLACREYRTLPLALSEFEPEVMFGIRFDGTEGFPRQAVFSAPSLKWLSVGGVGVDHLGPWDGDRITVTNAAGVSGDVMAQYAMAAILSFAFGFPRFGVQQRAREWHDGEVYPIDGKTVLVVGLGGTGRAVARRAKAMGLGVIGVRANPRPTPDVDRLCGPDDLDGLWGEADFIVLCVPLTDKTRNLVDARAFAAMKPEAVIVDISRGGVVSETDLIDALASGRIAGGARDVFDSEPLPRDHALWALDNLIITPHCAAVYKGWERRTMDRFCDNLERWKRGERLENVVDPGLGY